VVEVVELLNENSSSLDSSPTLELEKRLTQTLHQLKTLEQAHASCGDQKVCLGDVPADYLQQLTSTLQRYFTNSCILSTWPFIDFLGNEDVLCCTIQWGVCVCLCLCV
jgi:hypothetical protein